MRRCYSPSAASVLVAVWASAHTAAGFAPSARPLQSSPFARTAARNGLEKLKMGRIGSRSGADEGFREVGDAVRTQRRDPWDNPLAQPQTSKFWLNPFPLAPYGTARPTVATRISNDIYSFEQEHGFANVSVSIRMTVVRLADGGLWVHAPIAPTAECVKMVESLGVVKYVVLPTTGLEHKLFMGPFVNKFPNAQSWVAPGQWSWPVDIPLGFRVDGTLKNDDQSVPWASEIEQKVLATKVGIGKTTEVAFFHKKSASLIVTDAVIFIPPEAPEVVAEYRQEDLKWEKSALMACFLGAPYTPSFAAIAGKVFVSPVVRTFIYERTRDETRAWVDDVARWKFTSIIPAHLTAPIKAGPREWLDAFKSNPAPRLST
ncbi:hypothetical protein T484DRAFT_1914714 [Baffinella frigidus]|nr:hypothetical protein T484DRAFT_1914714 [Cryptophyta sp. CCMP2293]